MAHFTVHDVPDRRFRGAEGRETKTVLVKEGFSWGALALPGVWFLGKGHLVSFIAYILATGGTFVAVFALTSSLPIAAASAAAVHLMSAFEANRWRRYILNRRGAPVADMATGATATAAMRAYTTEIKAPTLSIPKGQPDLRRLQEFEEEPFEAVTPSKPRLPDPAPQPATANRRAARAADSAPVPPPAAVPASGLDAIMQFAGLRDRPFVADRLRPSDPIWQTDPSGMRERHERHITGDAEPSQRMIIGRRRRRRR